MFSVADMRACMALQQSQHHHGKDPYLHVAGWHVALKAVEILRHWLIVCLGSVQGVTGDCGLCA